MMACHRKLDPWSFLQSVGKAQINKRIESNRSFQVKIALISSSLESRQFLHLTSLVCVKFVALWKSNPAHAQNLRNFGARTCCVITLRGIFDLDSRACSGVSSWILYRYICCVFALVRVLLLDTSCCSCSCFCDFS